MNNNVRADVKPRIYRFGAFEFDGEAGELRRNGVLIRLAPQPAQVLGLLLERSGQTVTRDEIRQRVWGEFPGDLERNLNVCISQIRSALDDDARGSRFVATVPKEGYRFVAPVSRPPQEAARTREWPFVAAGVVAAIALAAALLWFVRPVGGSRTRVCGPAWDAYRTGRTLLDQHSRAALTRAVEPLRQAAATGCPEGAAALAATYKGLALSGASDQWPNAREWAAKAVALAPANAEALLALGAVRFWFDWDNAGAEDALRRAVKASPADGNAHHDLALVLIATGRRDQGTTHLRRAVDLAPTSARVNVDAGWLWLQAHQFSEAAAAARRALTLDPSLDEARACLSRALFYLGDEKGAAEALKPLVKDDRSLRDTYQMLAERSRSQFSSAQYLASLGMTEEALFALETAVNNREPSVALMRSDPAFESLKGNPRFGAALAKVLPR